VRPRSGARAPTVIAAVVTGASIIVAAAVFAMLSHLLRQADESGLEMQVQRLERDVAELQREARSLRSDIAEFRREQAEGALRQVPPSTTAPAPALPEALPLDQFGGTAPLPETEGLVDDMRVATGRFNQGIQRPRPQVLRELLGEPRQTYTDDCQPVTNPRIITALETRQIAGFRLTMLRPALDSLEEIMERLQLEEPEIFAALGTAGALCARLVRGAGSTVSSHAWGIAVDFTIKQQLDVHGDGLTQFGLVVLAEYFNEAGWFWGAAYSREDSMHFEVGEALLREWASAGVI
jgi:hypothetical protein